jgi:hypothetical protein
MSDCSSATREEHAESDIHEFKQAVIEWVRIEDELSAAQKILRDKRKRKQNLANVISQYLKNHDKTVCDLGDNECLVLSTRKTMSALKKENVLSVLTEVFNGKEDTAKSVMDRMYALRDTREKDVIKRASL